MICHRPTTKRMQRVLRVFISSTFRDMIADRDELVRHAFLPLRKLCEERGVVWREVDLRWGITDEQKAEGKVLPICLTEIARCRPFFIGLLGEHYCWVPDEIPFELLAQQPWLAEHREHSVTALEILHGVLRNPQMADRAFFYFRHPSYIDRLPEDEQEHFREGPRLDEIKRFGKQEADRRASERRQRLAELKQQIGDAGLPIQHYSDPQELGRLVREDMTNLINDLFPEEKRDELDREAARHEAYAASRTGVYIGRLSEFAQLDNHAAGDGAPLVVLGSSGSGIGSVG